MIDFFFLTFANKWGLDFIYCTKIQNFMIDILGGMLFKSKVYTVLFEIKDNRNDISLKN